jgi:hypothetical protein
MADIDVNLVFTALGSVFAWIFALVQYIVDGRRRKEDKRLHQKELDDQRNQYKKQVERPDPIGDLTCEVLNRDGRNYLLSTICINNLGKDDLVIDEAVYFIDKAKALPGGDYSFYDLDKVIGRMVDVKKDMSAEECQRMFFPELLNVHILTEYLDIHEHSIGHNENLRSHELNQLTEPGFYRATLIFHPTHPELDFIYIRSQIVYVTAVGAVSR